MELTAYGQAGTIGVTVALWTTDKGRDGGVRLQGYYKGQTWNHAVTFAKFQTMTSDEIKAMVDKVRDELRGDVT